MSKRTNFRKGTKVIIIVDRDGGFDTVEAIYERSCGSRYHQARKADGTIIQCHADNITRSAS